MEIGNRIKELRERNNISQLELSKKLNINNSVLSRIENNERSLRDTELILLSDFFQVSTDYLLGRTTLKNIIIDKKLIENEKVLEIFYSDK